MTRHITQGRDHVNFWQEMRRRRVFRLAGLYVVAAWLVIQVADVSFPAWGVPETALRWLFVAAAAGFPVALVFGWRYDITPQGIVRTERPGDGEVVDIGLSHTDYAILLALFLIGAFILWESVGRIQHEIEASPVAAAPVERPANSIAVLPFRNLDAAADTGYFSDGITEEILHRLSGLRVLHVLASTSSFAFRNSEDGPAGISEKLGVRYLLTGSVRRDSDYVRVTARLLDQTGFQLWSDSFDRRLEGIFSIQTEIAGAVATQIVNEIVPVEALPAGRTTSNMEAYNAYLAGQAYADARTVGWQEKARDAFNRAIELDPGYAPPYAGLAVALTVNTPFGQHWDEGLSLATKSVELDPELAYGHAALGLMQSVHGDYESGLSSLQRAIALDPSLAIAYNWMQNPLLNLGRRDEAIELLRRGLEVDPLNPALIRNVAADSAWNGDFPRAEQLLLRLVNLPEPPARTYAWLVMLYDSWGHYAEAVDAAKHDIRLQAPEPRADAFWFLSMAYAALGMHDDADYWDGQFRQRLAEDEVPIDATVELVKRGGNPAELEKELAQLGERIDEDTEDGDGGLTVYAGMARVQLGQFDEGADLLERGLGRIGQTLDREDGPEPIDVALLDDNIDTPLLVLVLHHYAFALQQAGRGDDATALLAAMNAYYLERPAQWGRSPQALEMLALQHALEGNREAALDVLREAVALGWCNYRALLNDPAWADTTAMPGFRALVDMARANVDEQRGRVEAVDARQDFRAEVEQFGPR